LKHWSEQKMNIRLTKLQERAMLAIDEGAFSDYSMNPEFT